MNVMDQGGRITSWADIVALAVTRAGHDVVLVNGAPYVVASFKSGWCIEGRCGDCRYASCGCDCHSEVAA